MPSDGLKVTDFGNRFVEDWCEDVRYESAGYAFPHTQVLENGLAMGRHNKTPVTDVPGACNWSKHKGTRPHRQAQLIALRAWWVALAHQAEDYQISKRAVRKIHRGAGWASHRPKGNRYGPAESSEQCPAARRGSPCGDGLGVSARTRRERVREGSACGNRWWSRRRQK
jgi:hypothetical protein